LQEQSNWSKLSYFTKIAKNGSFYLRNGRKYKDSKKVVLEQKICFIFYNFLHPLCLFSPALSFSPHIYALIYRYRHLLSPIMYKKLPFKIKSKTFQITIKL
jgi:cadmium resistance protein CadD (predicted permease)